jgi:hypothetical protein
MFDLLWIALISSLVSIALLGINIYYWRKLGFFKWIKVKKKEIIITLIWSTVVALVMIKAHLLVYINNPILIEYGIAWTEVDQWCPRLDTLDFLFILFISIVVGAILMDFDTILYSYIATTILSFTFAIIYACVFIWYVLKWGEVLSLVGGWWSFGDFVIYAAMKPMFRMFFPLVVLMCLLGGFGGAFIRGILQPSAESPK